MVEKYSNDEISRMIRMEQKAASSLNTKVPYNETKSYRELSARQRNDFQEYINKKGRASHVLLVLALLVYASFGVFYFNFTGNIIKEAVTIIQFSFVKYILNFLALFTTILIILLFMHDRIKQFIFEKHFKRNYSLY